MPEHRMSMAIRLRRPRAATALLLAVGLLVGAAPLLTPAAPAAAAVTVAGPVQPPRRL